MDTKTFINKIVKCSATHWSFVLNGHRNLGYKKAKIVSELLNTPVELWINPDASKFDRKKAWENFLK